MKSLRAFRVHHDLSTALELRARELGYPSVSALILALCRKDIYEREEHGKAQQWTALSWDKQDRIDGELLGHQRTHQSKPKAKAKA